MPAVTLSKDTILNADDELFWRKVREAYDQVAANNGLAISVEIGHKKASIQRDIKNTKQILIYLTDVTPSPPTLVAPT